LRNWEYGRERQKRHPGEWNFRVETINGAKTPTVLEAEEGSLDYATRRAKMRRERKNRVAQLGMTAEERAQETGLGGVFGEELQLPVRGGLAGLFGDGAEGDRLFLVGEFGGGVVKTRGGDGDGEGTSGVCCRG
jgi:hypothetical protein